MNELLLRAQIASGRFGTGYYLWIFQSLVNQFNMNRHCVFGRAVWLTVVVILSFSAGMRGQFRKSSSPPYDSIWVNHCIERAIQAIDANRIEEAMGIVHVCLDSASERYGLRSRELADILELEVTLCDYWGVTPDLLEKAALCLEMREEQFGKRHLRYASALVNLVHARSYTGLHEETWLPLLDEALDILENPVWRNSDERLNALNQSSLIFQQRGESVKAEKPLLEAITLERQLYGEERYEYSSLCSNLGNLYLSLGRLREGIRYLDISLEKTEKLVGRIHPDYCSTLMNRGVGYLRIGSFEESERDLLEALIIARQVYGQEHQNLAPYNWALSDYYGKTGLYERMGTYVDEGFRLAMANNKLPSIMAVLAYKQTGTWLEYTGAYEKAADIYISLRQKLDEYGMRKSIQFADITLRLGRARRALGETQQACELTSAAAELADSLYSSENPALYMLYKQHLLTCLETPEQVEHCYQVMQKGMGVIQRSYGEESINIAIWKHYAGRIYSERGQPDSALVQFRQVYSILGGRITDGFSFMTFEQQEAYLSAFDVFFNNMLSLGLKYPSDTAVCSFLYDVALFRKELLGINNSCAHLSWRNSENPATDGLSQRYFDLRQRAITLESRPAGEHEGLASLKAEIEKVERQLVKQSGYKDRSVMIKSGSWSEIRLKLKPGEAAIEYIMIPGYREGRFGALVLRSDSEAPVLVLLGETGVVNQYISNPDGRAFTYAERVYGSGETAFRVSELIWKPLESHLKGIKKIFLAPAAGLFQINFRALRTGTGIRLGDRVNLVCLTSTRQLMDKEFSSTGVSTGNGVLLVGGIDFDEISGKYTAEKNAGISEDTLSVSGQNTVAGDEERGIVRGKWAPLPETMREVLALDSILHSNHYETNLLTGRNAVEAAFKESGLQKPSIIHIASHGFFYEKKAGSEETVLPGFMTSSNPMLRSGLLFAGVNQVWCGGRRADSWNDGILTAEEVSMMNLGDVELVTLSACETGLGEIRNYEGLYGFQRAFRMAGARNLVMTLWRVPDNSTRLFMETFYANMVKRHSVREAFEAAVNDIRIRYPAPYYWAGYVLVDGRR